MKSRLFSAFDPEREENKLFVQHLQRALGSPDLAEACLGLFPAIRLARTRAEREDILEAWRAKTGGSVKDAVNVMQLFEFFVRHLLDEDFNKQDDTPENWADDLVAQQCLPESNRAKLVKLLGDIRDRLVPQLKDVVSRRKAASGVLPVLESCGITVELRAVQENRYEPHQSIAEYVPHVASTVAVISIAIGVDSGSPKEFFFQAEEEDLDFLINKLAAAKKDLSALRDFLGVGPCRR